MQLPPIEPLVKDPLAERLLPVLMHRMNNATQLLSNLHTLAGLSSERDWLGERALDLAHCAQDIERLGYLLAVLASASGADLLLERREARGVQTMIEAVMDLIRRDGGELGPLPDPVPDQSPRVHQGWELPWAVGALLQEARMAPDSSGPFEWSWYRSSASWTLASEWIPADGFRGLRARLERRLPEGRLELEADCWSWQIPGTWMVQSLGVQAKRRPS